jgi:hypothetical protein
MSSIIGPHSGLKRNKGDLLSRIGKNIKIVVIDCFYDTLASSAVQHLLGQLAYFKIHSYQQEYPYGILPFSGHDLVGTHLLLCEEKDGKFEILMGFKMLTVDQCEKFFLEFPAISVLSNQETQIQRQAIQEEIDKSKRDGLQFGYMGSWTIRPDIRKNKLLTKLCYDMSTAFIAWAVYEYGIEKTIVLASLRFHVDKFNEGNGFVRMKFNGKDLPDFDAQSFFGEPSCVSILYRENLSQKAHELVRTFQPLWNNRVEYKSDIKPVSKAA